jgi:hypothetical protein
MFILYDNLLDDATLTIPDENLYYGADNLQDTRLSKYYRSNTLSSNIVIDLGSAKQVTSFFVVDHTFTSSAVVKIQANTTDSWTTPAFELTLSITDYILYDFSFDETYQFWRLEFADPTNPEFVRIGRIMLGVPLSGLYMEPDQVFSVKTTTETATNRTGQTFVKKGYAYKNNTINIKNISHDKEAEIYAMFIANSNSNPVILVIYENDTIKKPPVYCFITNEGADLQNQVDLINPYKTSFQFRQTF